MDIYTVLLLVLVFGLSYMVLRSLKQHRNLPPGPRPLPFIGNSLQVVGRDVRQLYKKYAKIYGDLFTLHAFNRVVIVVNGYEAVKDICAKHGEMFSRRPEFDFVTLLPGNGIVFANGEMWKQNRRFVIRTLRDFGMGKSKLQVVIHEEIEYFLDAVEKEGEQPFNIEYYITIAVSNIICSLVFGKRFDYEDERFTDLIRRTKEIFATDFLTVPQWLKYIPGDPFHLKRTMDHFNHLNNFCREKLREHMETFDDNNIRDLIDAYIKQTKQGGDSAKQSDIDDVEITHIISDLFGGGTETTSSTLRFALLCMLRNPETQERISDEFGEHVPKHVLPDINDCKKVPYFQATISEIQRRGCIAPFISRAGKEDFNYRGYTIPKSAIVMINLESVLFDESVWNEPLGFNPSRFMEGSCLKERQEELIPFGTGSRMCAGESLARMQLNLFLSALLQRFRFLPPEGEEPPSLDTKLGLTAVIPPYKLRAIRRQ